MKRRALGLGFMAGLTVLAGAFTACSSGGGGGGGGDPVEYGTLRLPLTSEGASGTKYRLRDATFQISDYYHYYDYPYVNAGGESGTEPQTITVSSEDDPDAASIAVDLERGYYYVTLLPGWHMEKVEGGGATDVEATLLSDPQQFAYVSPHSTSWLEYQFGLGDRKLWFNGKLNIDIQIYEKPSELYGVGGAGVGGAPEWGGGGSPDVGAGGGG